MTISEGLLATKRSVAPRRRFRLAGPSIPIDPQTLAIRDDLADVELADRVFAPHYAAALPAMLAKNVDLLDTVDGAVIATCAAGQAIELFDTAGGWSWVRTRGLVGYVPAEAVALS